MNEEGAIETKEVSPKVTPLEQRYGKLKAAFTLMTVSSALFLGGCEWFNKESKIGQPFGENPVSLKIEAFGDIRSEWYEKGPVKLRAQPDITSAEVGEIMPNIPYTVTGVTRVCGSRVGAEAHVERDPETGEECPIWFGIPIELLEKIVPKELFKLDKEKIQKLGVDTIYISSTYASVVK